jgi:outer membrane protein OmpA-like peptidoglycan-associated protein/tetratricopeptide (TPR) repeat protein
MKSKDLFTLLLVLCFPYFKNAAIGQTIPVDAQLKKAVQYYNGFRYVAAIDELKPIVTADSTNVRALEMLAYSYKMVNNYELALKWFEALSKQEVIKPDWALNYAAQLAINQQYEKSENWYRRYLSLIPTDKRASNLAKSNLKDINKNTGHWQVDYTNLNTTGAEYSPMYYGDGLIFSSNRQDGKLFKHVFEWDNSPFTNLYVTESINNIKAINPDSLSILNQSKERRYNDDDTAPTSNDTRTLGQVSIVSKTTNANTISNGYLSKLLNNKINSKYHNGSAAIFPDGSIIFTRNNYSKGQTQKSTDGIVKLKLYTASGRNLSRITEFPYNSNEYSTGHPALNKAGNILIFTSDMPGGYGGTDLYYSVRSGKGPWTRPVNLGKKINTEGNEMFPFLDNNNKLYFASNGHAGLGGLDLFEVTLKEMKPLENPKNMATPINGSTDDFGLIIMDDYKSGFFSSNRKGNDDIYKFKRNQYIVKLKGKVYDAITRIPVQNSRIIMRHLDGADTIRTDVSGGFQRELLAQTDYELTAQKIGFNNKMSFLTSEGITKDSTIIKDIYLNRTENTQQYVLNNCDSLKRAYAVKNVYYDLDRYQIRPDARIALDELVALMKRNPSITILTSSHTDSRATEQYNRTLSLKRGETAKSYLVARGISPNRISVEYYGKTRLVNRCYDGIPCSEENQQLNRRTEFDVILNGINITRQNCADQ